MASKREPVEPDFNGFKDLIEVGDKRLSSTVFHAIVRLFDKSEPRIAIPQVGVTVIGACLGLSGTVAGAVGAVVTGVVLLASANFYKKP
jgi:hypothetical protein